jgi:putative membrane protein
LHQILAYLTFKIDVMNFLAQLILSAIAVVITSFILPGVHIHSVFTAIIVAAVLAFLNAIIKPILVILTIPITVVTLGLFLLIINAGMILLVSRIVPKFEVDGFWTAFFFSIILSLINAVFEGMSRGSREQ